MDNLKVLNWARGRPPSRLSPWRIYNVCTCLSSSLRCPSIHRTTCKHDTISSLLCTMTRIYPQSRCVTSQRFPLFTLFCIIKIHGFYLENPPAMLCVFFTFSIFFFTKVFFISNDGLIAIAKSRGIQSRTELTRLSSFHVFAPKNMKANKKVLFLRFLIFFF